MVVRWLVYSLRILLWLLAWPLRRLSRGPDYLTVELEADMPRIEEPRRWSVRRLFGDVPKLSVRQLDETLRRLAMGRRSVGLLVLLRPGHFPPAVAEAIHHALATYRDKGHEVIVWTKSLDLARLAIAAAGSKTVLAPGGSVGPLGISRELLYFGDAARWLGLELDVVQSGPHKSAYERFTRDAPSKPAKEMVEWLLSDLYDTLIGLIAKGRGVLDGAVQNWMDTGLLTDTAALEAGIVDAIDGETKLCQSLRRGDKPARLAHLSRASARSRRLPERPGRAGIGLLRVEGTIVDGRSRRSPLGIPMGPLSRRCGDRTFIAQCRAMAKNRRIKSVLLFIDSPGGSAAASEAMAEALDDLSQKKPLVAYMGSMAASGGYYVASPAATIIAGKTTLTGSIGVIMAKLVNAGLLGRLNIASHAFKRGARADLFAADRPFSDDERTLVQAHMERTYHLFTARVAASRKLTPERVDQLGRGRVWTGQQAGDRGLVDSCGDLQEGFHAARQAGGLPNDCPVFHATDAAHHWHAPGAAATLLQWSADWHEMLSSCQPWTLSTVLWRQRGGSV